jgi:hypothetical protein
MHCSCNTSSSPLVMMGASKCFDCDTELVNRWCNKCHGYKPQQTSDRHIYGFSGSGYAILGY